MVIEPLINLELSVPKLSVFIVESEAAAPLRLTGPAIVRVPALSMVDPTYGLPALSVRVPAPLFVKPPLKLTVAAAAIALSMKVPLLPTTNVLLKFGAEIVEDGATRNVPEVVVVEPV